MVGYTSSSTGEKRADRHTTRIGSLVMATLVCVGVFIAVGCKKPEQKVQKERSVNVQVLAAENRSLRPFMESVGTLKPYDSVVVSSEVDGILKSIRVEEGSLVMQNQLIAEVKDTDYRLGVEQAAAAVRQAEATLANLKLDHQRKEALYKEELVTKQQFDDIVARLAVAQGDVERAKASFDLTREKITKTSIFSPMAGAVSEKKVTEGDYIRNGTPLLTLIRTDKLKLAFSVVEKNVGSLREGQDVVFTVDAFPDREFRAQVKTIYPHLDEKSRSLQVEAVVNNPDQRLKPGLFARVTLYTGPARGTVVVPINALLYDNSLTKVFVVEGDRAKEIKVQIGRKYGDYIEITDGLKGKETVVTVGQNNLMEGVLVNVAR